MCGADPVVQSTGCTGGGNLETDWRKELNMGGKRLYMLAVMVLLGGALTTPAQETKPEAGKQPGTVVGTVTARGYNWIEVKTDDEDKAVRYTPHVIGGVAAEGGGPDRQMLETIRQVTVGSHVRLDWKFENGPRVLTLAIPTAGEGDQERR